MGNLKSKDKKGGKDGEMKNGGDGSVQTKQTLIEEAKQDFQEGNNFFRDRKFDQAKTAYSKALEKLTRCEKDDIGAHQVSTLTNLAAIEFAEGRYKEAKSLLERALAERRRAIDESGSEEVKQKQAKEGDTDNLTAISLALKRDMTFRQLPDSERLLAGEIKEHATIDAMTSDLFNNLAACCEVIGDLKEAQQFYEESLALRKLIYGERSIKVAESLQNIATILDFQGHQKEAERLLESALDIEVELYGADSVESSVTLNNLAVLCEHLGKLDQAENLLERCVNIRTHEYGADHHYTQSVKQNLDYVQNKKRGMQKSEEKQHLQQEQREAQETKVGEPKE